MDTPAHLHQADEDRVQVHDPVSRRFHDGVAGVIVHERRSTCWPSASSWRRFHDLAGWTMWEIVFLYGIWMMGNSLYSLLFLHVSSWIITSLKDLRPVPGAPAQPVLAAYGR